MYLKSIKRLDVYSIFLIIVGYLGKVDLVVNIIGYYIGGFLYMVFILMKYIYSYKCLFFFEIRI